MFVQPLPAVPTLMVVDCQEGFLRPLGFRASERIMRAYSLGVADIVRHAATEGKSIVFVEFEGYGDTIPVIRQAAIGGRPTVTIEKQADGIFESINDHARNLRAFSGLRMSRAATDMIGLNASACVLASAVELLASGIHCRVLAEGIINHDEERYGHYRVDNDVEGIRSAYRSW